MHGIMSGYSINYDNIINPIKQSINVIKSVENN